MAYDFSQVQDVSNSIVGGEKRQIVDARSAARFNSEADEPRPGVRRGNIPGSINLPFQQLLEEGDLTRFKSPEQLKSVFDEAGVGLDGKALTTCGSGVTACVISFAMHLAAPEAGIAPVYDGAWADWAARTDA